ncbi:DEAD/DEAH box helicase family protein [Candidatus Babeliales bacterium]|nr:DEAD/DEAH box helicase family protein [Candidatus Babeliales bacterium]
MSGVYFIKHTRYENIYKIGFSTCLKSRLSTYNTIFLEEDILCFEKIINSKGYETIGELRYLEKRCHVILKDHRKGKRELFELKFEEDFKNLVQQLESDNIKITISVRIPGFEVKESLSLDYSYQEPKIKLLNGYFNKNNEGMLVYPPGWGKTYIAGKIFENYKNIIIFVPQILIANEFYKMCKILKLPFDVEIINSDYTSGKDMKELKDGQIKIINYQSYELCKDRLNNVDLVVYDEAHHTSNINGKFGETLKLKSNKKLFLTATPKIIDEVDVKIPIIDRESIRDSIDKGRLCDYRLLVFNECSLLEMVKELINKHHRKKIILFFNRKENKEDARKSQIFSKLLNQNNITSYDLHGGCSRKDKESIINEFEKSNGISVICNVNMVSEGVSIPCADCLVFAEPRQSSIGVIQNIGRVLRKHPEKDIALICLPPNMADAVSIINILYHEDPKIRSGSGMFIGSEICVKKIEKTVKLIEISKTGGLWEYKYKIALHYEKNNGIIIGRKNTLKYMSINLDYWMRTQINNFKLNSLSIQQIEMLKNLESWNYKLTNKWLKSFNASLDYEKKYGIIQKNAGKHNEVCVNIWMTSQMMKFKKKLMISDRTVLFVQLKTFKYRIKDKFLEKINLCKQHEEKTIFENSKIIYKNKTLNNWIGSQITKLNKKELSEDKLILLKQLKIWKYKTKSAWKEWFDLCIAFEIDANTLISKRTIYKTKDIGMWIGCQLDKYKKKYVV